MNLHLTYICTWWIFISARFWLKKLLAQVHATQKIYLHNTVGTCTKEGLNKENTTQIAKCKKHSDLIPWKFVEMSNFFEFLFILKFVTKKLHAQCACRLENLLAQRKKCMHLCKCACVKSSTDLYLLIFEALWILKEHMFYYFIIFWKQRMLT